MLDTKRILASRTVWAAMIAVLAQILALVTGKTIAADDQALIVDAVAQVVTIVAGLAAIWARVAATKTIR
jgi:hypothetical protein